jgi:four helix bundle protein
MARDIRERTFAFAVRIVKLCQKLERTQGVSRRICDQLVRAGTSVGSNVEEAQAGQSRADFISKYAIALKEARETHFWPRLILATAMIGEEDRKETIELRDEAEELKKIVASIIVSAKK